VAKKKSDAKGDVYFVDPKHVVEPKNRTGYSKNRDLKNQRPVMIAVHKRSKKVQIAELTTVEPTEKQIRRHYMVPLSNTKTKKVNFVDTRVIAKSKSTNRQFKIGDDPLKTKSKIKVNQSDLNSYDKARKKRYPGLK